ncbi:MAG: aminopeptidase P family protein [Alphaproteobacteria bacterium]|nr:aminopeptidase P family protein [Alphaproteobacteria bacterium]
MTNVTIGLTPGAVEPWPEEDRDLAFPLEEYRDRIHRVRKRMAKARIDLLYVTVPDHVAYLHGFIASWYKANSPMRYPQLYGTAIHVDSEDFIHFDNPTEAPVLQKTSVATDCRWFPSREASPNLAFIMGELKAKGWLRGTVGMEHWGYIPNRAISTMFEGAFLAEGCRVVDASAIVRRVRRVKSPAEITYIEEATRIADIGHATVIRVARPGMTELEVYGETLRAMMAAGGESPALVHSFTSAPVRNGRAVAAGHAMMGRKKIRAGEFLKIDIAGVYYRYHGNVQRGYILGEAPKSMVEQVSKAAGAFDVFAAEVRCGMTVREVNAVMRRYYQGVGLWDQPGWALGYELGLSLPPDWVGEFYFHVRDDKYLDRVFEENMVTNFESMFNTWLVDTCVYGKTGTRILSKTPLQLQSIG